MNRRHLLGFLASVLLGAVLILILIRIAHLDLKFTLAQVLQARTSALAKLAVLNALLVLLSTEKWRCVDSAIRETWDCVPTRAIAFVSTAAGMALGLILPVQLGMSAARTAGVYFYGRPLKRGTAATLFEQSFDLVIVCFIAIASAVTWLTGRGAAVWGTVAVVAVLAAVTSAGPFMHGVRLFVAVLGNWFGPDARFGVALKNMAAIDTGILSSDLARRLMALSALRFGVLVLMATETASAIGVRLSFWQMGAILPFVSIANILAVTPGGVGVNELTAVAALKAFGVSTDVAARWSIANRILIMASAFLVAAVSLLVLGSARAIALRRQYKRRQMDAAE